MLWHVPFLGGARQASPTTLLLVEGQYGVGTNPNPDANAGACNFSKGARQVCPTTLLLVEGSGQLGYAMNWGDGFVTDRPLVASYGLADANAFFGALLSKPYLNNVVISPHYYPPSVSKAQSGCAALSATLCIPHARPGTRPPWSQHRTALNSPSEA